MSIIGLTEGLVVDDKGIWRGGDETTLSYPEEGHAQCHQLEDASFWFKHRNECILSVIKKFPPAGPVLDVGGGNGYVTRALLDNGFDAVLLEPGSTGAVNGKVNRHIPEVICATLEEARFPSDSLSAIGCFDVIEHIEDDQKFVKQALQLLVPGGLMYVTVPAHQWLWSSSDVSAQHYRRYNISTISNLFGDGFDVEFSTYFFMALTPLIFILRALPYRFRNRERSNVMSSEAEHGGHGGIVRMMLDFILHREAARVDSRKKILFGTSCLIVARKKICNGGAPEA